MPDAPSAASAWIDGAPAGEARDALLRCCGSRRWVEGMLTRRPFGSARALEAASSDVWSKLERDDYLEAFAHHPAIGADLAALRARFPTAAWSVDEQSGVAAADEGTLVALREANEAYRRRFGYVFLICATGKTAAEMLGALRSRIDNDPVTELGVAAGEQAAITRLRLEKIGR